MPEFSVKKPLTIFCCAIAILVLGIVAYTRMTPDLFPSMDFPYVIIMTADPGASPETVEETITKPMERSMATLDHIKSVSSSSADNYSMVMLEFEDDVNLDSIGVDIQQQISTLQAGWSETVGTPYVLKINPSMIPVMVAAVSMEGMDVTQLSEFVDETLMPQLEGTTGVARVTASGSIEQELHIVISQEKIDALNEVIAQGINDQMDAAVAQLNAAKAQLTGALQGMQRPAAPEPEPPAESAQEAEERINGQMARLEENRETIENTISSLETIRAALNDPSPAPSYTPEEQARRAELEQQITDLDAQLAPYETRIQNIQDSDAEQTEKLRQIGEITQDETYRQLVSDRAAAQIELTTLGVDLDTATQETFAQMLPEGLTIDQLDTAIAQLVDTLTMVRDSMDELSALQSQLEQNSIDVAQVNQMYQQITAGSGDLNASLNQLIEGVMGMSMAMIQIESGLNSIEGSRDSALAQADLNNLLTLQMVSQILAAQNFSMPAGYVEQDGISYMVSVGDEFTTQEQLENLLLFDLGLEDVEPIYVKDVANVFITDNSDSTYARLGNADGLMLSFEKQSNYATADVSGKLTERPVFRGPDGPGRLYLHDRGFHSGKPSVRNALFRPGAVPVSARPASHLHHPHCHAPFRAVCHCTHVLFRHQPEHDFPVRPVHRSGDAGGQFRGSHREHLPSPGQGRQYHPGGRLRRQAGFRRHRGVHAHHHLRICAHRVCRRSHPSAFHRPGPDHELRPHRQPHRGADPGACHGLRNDEKQGTAEKGYHGKGLRQIPLRRRMGTEPQVRGVCRVRADAAAFRGSVSEPGLFLHARH